MNAQYRETLSSTGLLILRIGIGGYMMTHGFAKLRMLMAGQAEMMGDPIGLGPTMTLLLLVFAEFFCAGAVVLGLATRLAAVPIVIAMAVAGFVAHAADPWTMTTAAMQYMAGEAESWASRQPALMFMFSFLALVLTGPGRFSLDAVILSTWRGRQDRPE